MIQSLTFPSALTAFSATTATAQPQRARSAPAHWRSTMIWVLGIVLCLLTALASLPRAAWADDGLDSASRPTAAAAAHEPSAAPALRARVRCTTCGVVEAIRRVEPAGAQPAAYEFTVRLRDGSARVSTVAGTSASPWLVGDPIMLMGGS